MLALLQPVLPTKPDLRDVALPAACTPCAPHTHCRSLPECGLEVSSCTYQGTLYSKATAPAPLGVTVTSPTALLAAYNGSLTCIKNVVSALPNLATALVIPGCLSNLALPPAASRTW